jgi:hypothetical protein
LSTIFKPIALALVSQQRHHCVYHGLRAQGIGILALPMRGRIQRAVEESDVASNCTYAYIPFQYASVVWAAYLFTAHNLSWLGYDGPLPWTAKIG